MFIQTLRRFGTNKDLGILLLRVSLGLFFFVSGVFKFENLKATIGFFSQIGLGSFWVYVASSAEILSGLLLILGIFIWIAAALIVIIMIVAIYLGTGPNPQGQSFFLHLISGWGPNVVYAAAALTIALCGAGRWSIADWVYKKKSEQAEVR